MPACLHLYTDDSGTRKLDRSPGKAAPKFDYFAMGGILLAEADEAEARRLHAEFCRKWGITAPLHSFEIRYRRDNFEWLKELTPARLGEFYGDIRAMVAAAPVHVIACVIDRPGYDRRYRERYAGQRWRLCKTAFNILLERAARVAIDREMKLRVFPERCNKDEDRAAEGYYREAVEQGMPFNPTRSAKYNPLIAQDMQGVLYEFRLKRKSSPMVQLADLVLYPVARQPYDPGYEPFHMLREDGKLIDCILPEPDIPLRGIKYSCFDVDHADWSGRIGAPGPT